MDDHSRENLNSSEPSNSDGGPQGETQSPVGGKSQTRRRFLKAGLISVPMIVTLRGRPAHAQVSLGSVGNIFYGRYELFLRDRNDPNSPRDRWAPADQNGREIVDPTRRNQEAGSYKEPAAGGTGAVQQQPTGPHLDDWLPDDDDYPHLDDWSPD